MSISKDLHYYVTNTDDGKHVVIGDTHGRNLWEKIVEEHLDTAYKIIFVGDYVDSYGISRGDEHRNLRNIISFKLRNMDKVVLLLGNHDLPYMFNNGFHGCSGFSFKMLPAYNALFNTYKDLFQLAYEINYGDVEALVTHAGVSNSWFNERFMPWYTNHPLRPDKSYFSTGEFLNMGFNMYITSQKEDCPLFDIGALREGNHKIGGPVWCSKKALLFDPLNNQIQIVGHTPATQIEVHTISQLDAALVFVDVLGAKQTLEDVKRRTLEQLSKEEEDTEDFCYTINLKNSEFKETGSYKDGGTTRFKVSATYPFKLSSDKRILVLNKDMPTEIIMDNNHTFYIDRRIGTTTPEKVYDKYPGDEGARLVNIKFV